MGNWQTVKISEFLKEREGRYDPLGTVVRHLKRLNKIDFSGKIHLSDKASKTNMIVVEPGDLVISGINVAKGALAIYHGDAPITATIHYSSYSFDENKIDIEYFKHFVKSQKFVQILREQVKGGIKTEIKSKHFLPLEIQLPNLNIQREIVAFFGRIENEMNVLGSEISIQHNYLKQLRQRVLQDAIEGKLSAAWRKSNHSLINGENHASKLLEKVKFEKGRLNKEGGINRGKPLTSIIGIDMRSVLPEGWAWCRLGEIIYDLPRNGYSPKAVSYKTETKSLKLGATTYGIFDPTEYKYVADEIPVDSVFWLEPGDILIQRSNSRDYVGVSAIYTGGSKEFIYPDLMMKVRIVKPISIKLIHLFLSSPALRQYFRSNAKGSQQTMPKINQGIVVSAAIPLPPLAEQTAIVEYVNKLMGMIDGLENQVAEREAHSDMLRQAVLRETFAV